MSNKSMFIGMIAGVGIATAGGVAAYQFLGHQAQTAEQGVVAEETGSQDVVVARAEPVAAVPQTSAPRAQTSAPRAQQTSAPRAQTTARAPAAAPAEECWDEEVTVQTAPKDENAIAGTAVGAVVGGAIGKDVGDRNLTTAAGAAAGAYIGRKIQKKVQENNADARTETHIERRCAPAGTPH